MSLLGSPKAKTHKSLAMDKLLRLAGEVEELGEDGEVSAEALDELGEDLGVPREKLYAGLGLSNSVQLTLAHDTQFVVCTGGCQEYGALECVRALLDAREDRLDEGKTGFDVVPRHCLNRCQQAPVVEIRSSAGVAVVTDAKPDTLVEAVSQVLD